MAKDTSPKLTACQLTASQTFTFRHSDAAQIFADTLRYRGHTVRQKSRLVVLVAGRVPAKDIEDADANAFRFGTPGGRARAAERSR